MNLIEERRRSRIRRQIRQLRHQHHPAQLKINLSVRKVMTKQHHSLQRILIEEIGWEAYEWQRR